VFRTRLRDGAKLEPGEIVCQVEGRARALLSAERVALNLLQHLSGVASLTARFVAALDGTGVKVRDTRKTLPGLRVLEKYAVLVGGGQNHRFGLFDMFLIKDNHLPAVGSITGAVRAARRADSELLIQVEVRNAEEAREAVRAGVDQILLDNMAPPEIATAVEAIDEECESATPARKRPWVEVSGGVQLANVRERALKGVDSVSIGALTHSAPALDLSLTIESIEDFA
ncbi:MAG TPA: carboxylating nicotinate-nucleotide diphosphorylase, partial [Candidatus Udaeobacter sp.]|nr:carboxylating nicotinate-nucleotide diphosphorylase [Candidatus Udaeobacter sp.]